ncbi:unnamed protein product [Alopecurus aequalis]
MRINRHLRLANRRVRSRYRSLFFLPDDGTVTDTTVHAWSPGSPLVAIHSDDERLRGVAVVTRQCRGLVVLEERRPYLFCSNSVNHYIYNPSTGQMTTLPKGKKAFGMWPHNQDSFGIGYDSSIQKHKVVRLYCRGDLLPACEVFVLNSTVGNWRPPASEGEEATPPGFATSYCTDQSVSAQGHLYLGAEPDKKFKFERVIISFSIRAEVFGILPPPPVQHMYQCRITELDGRLCLFNNSDSYKRLFDIWMLHDHAAGTWGIHCRIDLDRASLGKRMMRCSSWVIPLDIVDDGNDILLRPDPHGIQPRILEAHQLYVYRPATGDVEDLLANGGVITDHTGAHRVAAPYEESLESTGL